LINNPLHDSKKFQALIIQVSYDFLSADSQNIDYKINRMLQMIGEFFEVDRSYLFFTNENFTHMTNTHEWCSDNIHSVKDINQNLDFTKFPYWNSIMHDCIAQNKPFLIASVDALPIEAELEKQSLNEQNVKTLFIIPITKNNRAYGFFGFDSVKQEKIWDPSQISLLSVIGNIISVVLEKIQSEKALIEARKIAEIANNAKSLFLANMSHEIRTPLNSIIGFTNLLKETNLDEKQLNYVNYANNSAEHLQSIVNDILDFSKVEAGKMELDIQNIDILSIFSDLIAISRLEAERKGLIINFNHDPNLPRFVYVDPFRIKQILINLISNAIKFTEVGHIDLELKFEDINSEENIGNYLFSIKDTGIGISPEKQKRLFKLFSQADASTTRKYGGTGLGLIISNKLAELMNSAIIVSSEEGKGSTFYFSLKANYNNKDFSDTPDPNSLKAQIVISNNIGLLTIIRKTILIVEDVEVNLILLKTVLRKIVPQSIVLEAKNGKEAVEIYQEAKPDLIIMDIQMPIMDGYEATSEIRRMEKSINMDSIGFTPIVALTAGALVEEREKALKNGMNDFCTKPVRKNEILTVLAKYLI
jgi:signal transduction histidine kinase/CheY-like chemotaxis protein